MFVSLPFLSSPLFLLKGCLHLNNNLFELLCSRPKTSRSLSPFLCASLLHLSSSSSFPSLKEVLALAPFLSSYPLVCPDLKGLDWCKQYGDCATLPSLRPYCFHLSTSLLFEDLDESIMAFWRARVSYTHIIYSKGQQ